MNDQDDPEGDDLDMVAARLHLFKSLGAAFGMMEALFGEQKMSALELEFQRKMFCSAALLAARTSDVVKCSETLLWTLKSWGCTKDLATAPVVPTGLDDQIAAPTVGGVEGTVGDMLASATAMLLEVADGAKLSEIELSFHRETFLSLSRTAKKTDEVFRFGAVVMNTLARVRGFDHVQREKAFA